MSQKEIKMMSDDMFGVTSFRRVVTHLTPDERDALRRHDDRDNDFTLYLRKGNK